MNLLVAHAFATALSSSHISNLRLNRRPRTEVLTVFSIPKPFCGHIEAIQRNAIESWCRLEPCCEIVLCGNEFGVENVVDELGLKWLPNLSKNCYGTPLISSAFDQVLKTANHELVCYVNSDIILLSDFLQAVRQVNLARFLLVGQRWDLDINRNWGFQGAWEEKKFRRLTADYGELHPPSGSDYFVFQRNSRLGKLPPFAVGRPGWDNWLIYRARYLRIPVIDMTRVTTVIHQNHNYNHVQQKEGDAWEGPEARENRRLAGGSAYVFTLQDVDKILTREGLRKPRRTIEHLSRQAETIPVLYPRLRFVARYVNRTIKIIMAVYLKVTKSITR